METQPTTKAPHWVVGLFYRKWIRVGLLVSVAAFEIFLTYFLKTNGWFATLDWGTQILVIVVAGSPLLLALYFLAGKTFRLSSVFVALTLVGVFLTLVIQPVLREQNARVASLNFFKLGIEAGAETWHVFEGLRAATMFNYAEREKPTRMPEWIARLSGFNQKLFRDDQFKEVYFETDEQLVGGADSLKHCENLLHLTIGSGVSNARMQQHLDVLAGSSARSIQFGTEYGGGIARFDLSKLNGNPNVNQLTLANFAGAFEQFSRLDLPNLEQVTFWSSVPYTTTNWDLLFNCPRINAIKRLGLNYSGLDDVNAHRLKDLDKLESLYIHNALFTDIGFVAEMDGLQELFVAQCPLTNASVEQLGQAKQLKWIVISGCGVSPTLKEKLEKALPNCEIIAVD